LVQKPSNRVTLLFVVSLMCVLSAQLCADNSEETSRPEWNVVEIPSAWKNLGGESQFHAWFRCLVEIPETWKGQPLELFCEAVDDAREIYFNGKLVGTLGTFPPEFRSGLGKSEKFPVEASDVLGGQPNLIAIRVFQKQGRSGFNVAAPVLFGGKQAIRLLGQWQSTRGDDLDWARLSARGDVDKAALFAELSDAEEVERTLKKLDNEAGPFAAEETLRRITTPDDLSLSVVLEDQDMGQPLSFKFDARGRLWVMQYLQYPEPAGLTMLSRDKFLRSVYDTVPEPPPHHFHGKDKITIHEDQDGDGYFEFQSTFVEGLSLATSFAIGRGGVWVLNPPYLLFYPDHNRDDLPDGDPVVHLEGFGLEDSHSIANSLRWGPDGWLYACQGSTVTGSIRQYGTTNEVVRSLGQLIWRYHPEMQKYEVFAEGGGNSFGLEVDAYGRMFSGHNGGDSRGFHYVQGGYYLKGFGKHGSLSNPHAFGHFAAMKHPKVPRFVHDFVIYEDDLLSPAYHEKLFGVEPLQGRVVISDLRPNGASFETEDVGYALTSTDTWVRPVDIDVGPDGAIYVADFYEQRIDHASHYQGRIDRGSGRIYRFGPAVADDDRRWEAEDLDRYDTAQLVSRLVETTVRWEADTLLRIVGDRHDAAAIPLLESAVTENTGRSSLRALWGLNLSGGLTEDRALDLLNHPDPFVRLWTVRLVCDDRKVSPRLAERLAEVALTEPNVEVRCQLACSARRLPAGQALPVVRILAEQASDAEDIFIPLLLWWAIEDKAETDSESILGLFQDAGFWDLPIIKQSVIQRLMRRYAATGRRVDLLRCAKLLRLAPSQDDAQLLMAGFEEAYEGRSIAAIPDEMVKAMSEVGGGSLSLRLRQGQAAAIEDALSIIRNESEEIAQRIELIRILGEVRHEGIVVEMIALINGETDAQLCSAALSALGAFDDPFIGEHVVQQLQQLEGDSLEVAQTLLASRKTWAKRLLDAVDAGELPPARITPTILRKMLLHQDDHIKELVQKYWGEVQGATSTEMLAAIEHYYEILAVGSGSPYSGQPLYVQSCGKCHQLFDRGGEIGPDLTSYRRDDVRAMLVNVVNPSLEIREGFENYVVYMNNGRTIAGLLMDQDNQVVVIKSADGQRTVISRDEIDEMTAISQSIMPEGLLTPLDPQQIRDLFAYLRATQPLP